MPRPAGVKKWVGRIMPVYGLAAGLLAALAAFGQSAPAVAQQSCSIELVLALDVSGSVTWPEYRLQRAGVAAAFRDRDVTDLIEALPGGVSVIVTQWSDQRNQNNPTRWHHLTSREDALVFAGKVGLMRRGRVGDKTAIGNALLHAELMHRGNPRRCDKRVIDISGDGRANEGISTELIADRLEIDRVTINALVIVEDDRTLLRYFRQRIIRGPGAFAIMADGWEDYRRAFRRKLLRELAPGLVRAPYRERERFAELQDSMVEMGLSIRLRHTAKALSSAYD